MFGQTYHLDHLHTFPKSFSGISHLPTFCKSKLVVDGTMDGKENKEEKIMEIADMRMYHFRLEFPSTRIRYAVVMLVDIKNCYSLNMSDNNKIHVIWWSTTL